MPLNIDFERGVLKFHKMNDPDAPAVPPWIDVIMKDKVRHQGADTLLTYRHRLNDRNQPVINLSLNILYQLGVNTPPYLRPTRTLLGNLGSTSLGYVSGEVVPGDDEEDFDLIGYADAYHIEAESGTSMLAVVNHRDRLVSLTNSARGRANPGMRVDPISIESLDAQTQLEDFGLLAIEIGRSAIPGIAGQNQQQVAATI
jgi:hypothetical protein